MPLIISLGDLICLQFASCWSKLQQILLLPFQNGRATVKIRHCNESAPSQEERLIDMI